MRATTSKFLTSRRTLSGWGLLGFGLSLALSAGFCLPLCQLGAAQKIVRMNSGERLLGEVLPSSDETTLVLKSGLLGELKLPRTSVVSIEDKPVQAPVQAPIPVVAQAPQPKPKPEPKPAPAAAPATPKSVAEAEPVEEDSEFGKRLLRTAKALKAPDSWKGDLRFGLNMSSGDKKWTETFARGKLEVKPKGSRNYYRYSGAYSYRETERSNGSSYVSTDRYDLNMIYRRSFSQDWFFQNSAGYRVDEVKGISHELKDSLGMGYKYKITPKMDLLFGGGGGVEDYQTNFEDTRQGLNPILNVFQEFTWRPIQRTTISQKLNYYWNPGDTKEYNYIFSTAVRLRLTDLLGFEFSFNQNFDSDVGNGNPKDETQWRNALVVYF